VLLRCGAGSFDNSEGHHAVEPKTSAKPAFLSATAACFTPAAPPAINRDFALAWAGSIAPATIVAVSGRSDPASATGRAADIPTGNPGPLRPKRNVGPRLWRSATAAVTWNIKPCVSLWEPGPRISEISPASTQSASLPETPASVPAPLLPAFGYLQSVKGPVFAEPSTTITYLEDFLDGYFRPDSEQGGPWTGAIQDASTPQESQLSAASTPSSPLLDCRGWASFASAVQQKLPDATSDASTDFFTAPSSPASTCALFTSSSSMVSGAATATFYSSERVPKRDPILDRVPSRCDSDRRVVKCPEHGLTARFCRVVVRPHHGLVSCTYR
jgi:hypothetical protein